VGNTYRYRGKAIPRRDGVDVVTGGSAFLDDLRFHSLLYGKVLRSPHPHALLNKIDATQVTRIKGLKTIVTRENVPDRQFGNPPIRLRAASNATGVWMKSYPVAPEKALKGLCANGKMEK
jgi:CO/xanthine dehydrogenase Mo-binding subunit